MRKAAGSDLAGLSEQQQDILDAIARLKRDKNGHYSPSDVSQELVQAGDRSGLASLSRAIIRLERRGLIRRWHRHHEGKKHGWYFFTLTEAGLTVINDRRKERGLDALEMVHYEPKPPMTDEEFAERMQRLHDDWQLIGLKNAWQGASEAVRRRFLEWANQEVNISTTDDDVNRQKAC